MSGDWFERLARHPLLLPPEVRAENGGAELLALLRERHATERLPPTGLAQRQRAQLLALARHCAAHSPHFAARLKAAGLTPSALAQEGGLTRLPPLTRAALVAAGEALFCTFCPASLGPIGTTSTSGSTGEPVTVRRTGLCRQHWLADTLREHLWHDRDFAGSLAVIRATIFHPVALPDWGPPAQLLFRTGPGSAMPSARSLEELCHWLAEFAPAHLLIPPSTLAGVVATLAETGRRLPGLQTIRTLSETVHPELRAATARVLGLPIHDTYSSQEGGIMATQCPAGSYHVAEHCLLEILDPAGQPCAPGQVGRIVLTDLVNFATPLLRYEIGDYAEPGPPCACGRGLPVIRRFLGRERNLVLLPDGTRHWPTVGFHRWGEAFPVRQFQFIQLDRTTILARLFAVGRPDAAQEARLTALIQAALHHPFTLRYEWHAAPLPRGPGGKFEEFVCQVEA